MAAVLLTKSMNKTSVIRTIPSFIKARNEWGNDVKVGFVPTMGALHEGHLSLISAAKANNTRVVASIFVNPTQFSPTEDLSTYPRQLERDVELLSQMGVDLIFAPDTQEMYSKNHCTVINPTSFCQTREGLCRPDFFKGVATVVTKLFNIVRPTNAYFGQKDAAQCVSIKRFVEDLNIQTNVVVMPTLRETDGLAMSSRNAYLKPEERQAGPIVFKALEVGRKLWQEEMGKVGSEGSVDSEIVRLAVERELRTEKLIGDIQYISIDSLQTMLPIDRIGVEGGVVSLAVKCGSVRLIDNVLLDL